MNNLSSNNRGRKSKKNKRKKKKNDDDDEDGVYEWKQDKERLLAILCDMLRQRNLVKLWDMNTPSELFGNLFFNTAMSALENSKNHGGSRSNNIQSQIFDLIGLSLSKYSTNVSASSQLIRMLQTSQWSGSAENKLSIVVAELIAVVVSKYNQPLTLHEMMTEIGHLNGKELARDTKGTKALSFFLKEIADREPKLVLSKISLVVNHLDQESYVMRNGIITMIGSLIENGFKDNAQSQSIEEDEVEKKKA